MWCAIITSIIRHVQHHFYAFRGTVGTDYWLCYWHLECGTEHCLQLQVGVAVKGFKEHFSMFGRNVRLPINYSYSSRQESHLAGMTYGATTVIKSDMLEK